MKRSHSVRKRCVDWSLCYICQTGNTKKKPLRHTAAGVKSLADNLFRYWEAGKLDFDVADEVEFKDGQPNFDSTFLLKGVQYHHDCTSVYRKKIKTESEVAENMPDTPQTRSNTVTIPFLSSHCIFCSQFDDHRNMSAAGTLYASRTKVNPDHNQSLTDSWKHMAAVLRNQDVLARLANGDLAANSIFYHKTCYVEFKNDYHRETKKPSTSRSSGQITDQMAKDLAFSKVVQHLNCYEAKNPGSAYIVLELEDIYLKCLESHGITKKSHITDFTALLLENIPSLEKTKHNNKNTVMFRETVDKVVQNYIDLPDEDKQMMKKICTKIRKDILAHQNSFSGFVDGDTQKHSVPASLLLLTTMLVDGSDGDTEPTQESLTCSQVLQYNALKQQSTNTNTHYKDKRRETPIMLYNTLKIYSTVRSKTLIDHLYAIGLCIPYKRLLEVTKQLYDGMISTFPSDKTFIPKHLRKGIFTVLAKDNLDLNATSTFVTSHYHGTSISILQFPTTNNKGTPLPDVVFKEASQKSLQLQLLPEEYTNPSKLTLGKLSKDLWAPLCSVNIDDIKEFPELKKGLAEERYWLQQTLDAGETSCKGWSQFHASHGREVQTPRGINSIAPLLRKKVATLEMQNHIMKLNQRTVAALNPGQTVVDWSDCPVYALTKEMMFRDPLSYICYVAFMGGLHIQQTLLVTFGQLIKGCGLLAILEQNNFSTLGLSAVVNVNHIARAMYALQVLMSTLYAKLKETCSSANFKGDPMTWLKDHAKISSMCQFLYLVMTLGLQILLYVRSIREGNFKLHVEVLRKLIPWFFTFDHFYYGRWTTVHLFDLMTLEKMHPDVYREVMNGSFSFKKTDKQFSRMSLDQVHEQNNAVIKGKGGVTDLINRSAESGLIRWEVCGPELSRMTADLEEEFKKPAEQEAEKVHRHHDYNNTFQQRFSHDISVLVKAIDANPFGLTDLAMINDTSQLISKETGKKLYNLLDIGEKQFTSFFFDRLVFQKVPISEPIKLNKLNIWQTEKTATYVLPDQRLMNKVRCAALSRTSQAKEVFNKELFGFPQSLSTNGISMYHGTKSDMIRKFEDFVQPSLEPTTSKSAIIIDMAHLIHAKTFADLETFGDFASSLYFQVSIIGENFDRWDLCFDRYFEDSLKAETRRQRGSGCRYAFTEESPLPNKMQESFLKNDENKNKLNLFLAKQMIKLHRGSKTLVATYKDSILVVPPCQANVLITSSIGRCQSEEADQRVIRHAVQCSVDPSDYELIVLLTGDTDVLVLSPAYLADVVNSTSTKRLVLKLTSTSSSRFYDIVGIIRGLGKDICKALPWFHAATGCDLNSSFYGKGKVKAWDTWMKSEHLDDLTALFQKLGDTPTNISEIDFLLLKCFFVEMYKKDFAADSLGVIRLKMYLSSAIDDLRKLPPSESALLLHVKRASFIAGYLWQEARADLSIPDPQVWGWHRNDQGALVVQWQVDDCAISVDDFTMTCSCRSKSCMSCKCAKAGMICLSFCNCMRQCKNS